MKSKHKNRIGYFLLFSMMSTLLIVFSSGSPSRISTKNYLSIDTTLYTNYLELRGTIRETKIFEVETVKTIYSALIIISSTNFQNIEIWTNKKGKSVFRLPLDKIFKIKVSKKGFATKLFDVNTKVPFDKRGIFSFVFDVDMLVEIKGLDVSILKNSIAKVAYNLVEEKFAYDITYTNKINAELKKMYRNYYLLQKIYSDSSALPTHNPPQNKK